MYTRLGLLLTLTIICFGCAGADNEPEPAATAVSMPMPMLIGEGHGGAMGAALNTELKVDEEILAAWSGIKLRLEDGETGGSQEYLVPLGDTVKLGDSGLELTAEVFVPAFVMDEGGIVSRSAEQENPAARVVIREQGQEDYHGWLFAAMPGIHAYPHERYTVLLVEGIPAE